MRLIRKAVLLAAVWMLPVFASAASAADSSELDAFKAAIRAQYDLKEKAFADGDPNPIVEQFYSEDVISVDNEGNTHRGRAELRPVYEEVTKFGNVRIESVNTKVSGNMGWDWANFYVTPKDPAEEPFSFKILFLWEKVDGRWWSAGDMYVIGRFDVEQ
jgi:ketosteroid isomerase-like protein